MATQEFDSIGSICETFPCFLRIGTVSPERGTPLSGRLNYPAGIRFSALAKELGVVLPISYFEKANNAHYNSLAVFDADGSCAGRYRKSHIPDGPG